MPVSVQTWSKQMDELFDAEIHRPVVDDPRTFHDGNVNPLGYPYKIIQPDVLKCGRADFSKPYTDSPNLGTLSPDDLATLYCYMNLRGHFHSTKKHFWLRRKWLLKRFVTRSPMLIDVGCGPATSALALADVFPQQRVQYIGIDSSTAMRCRAATLLSAAVKRGLLDNTSSIRFETSWESLPELGVPDDGTVMFNFAFFFASSSLRERTLRSLAKAVRRVGRNLWSRTLIISYTNSRQPVAHRNYREFLDMLRVFPKSGMNDTRVRYRNRLNQNGEPKEQKFSRELFELEFE